MRERDKNGEDENNDLELELKLKQNPCSECPIWDAWKFTLSKNEKNFPHPIDGIEECEICPDRTDWR